MGSKKGSGKEWYDYHISMHLGYCHGPVDSLLSLKIKDKEAWAGNLTGNASFDIERRDLFGGNEREGGVAGRIHFLAGTETQLLPAEFAARLGGIPTSVPGFRHIMTLVMHGNSSTQAAGFLVASNYPNVPAVAARIRRSPKGLEDTLRTIWYRPPRGDGESDLAYELRCRANANPVHMIYEALIDQTWGMGGNPFFIDTDSFLAASQTIYDEQFGLSMVWTRQSTVEAFVQEVVDHIQALVFFNPRIGKIQIKLLRDDFDRDNLPTISPDNAICESFRRPWWGETTNEVVISWTNPDTEKEETVTIQDLANISMQGAVVSETRNYYGVRDRDLAGRLAARDIVAVASPKSTAVVRLDRRAWDILPGDVRRFTWPEYGVENVFMRVMDIDYGKPDDSTMKVTLLEDVFSLSSATFVRPPESEWTDPRQDPNSQAMQLQAVFSSMPYTLIQQRAGGDGLSDDLYPQIAIAAMVTPNQATQSDVQSFVLHGESALPTGTTEFLSLGEKSLTGMSTLAEPLVREVESVVLMGPIVAVYGPEAGGFAMIGTFEAGTENPPTSFHEETFEYVAFIEDLGNGAWRVMRGALDTIPREWPARTQMRFIGFGYNAVDTSGPLALAEVKYKLRPRTSLGIMDLNLAQVRTTIRPDRSYRPYRPANVAVGGSMWSPVDLSGDHNPRNWSLSYTWANRNRTTEDAVYRRWNELSVPVEDGQLTKIYFLENWYLPDLPGDSYSLDILETGQEETLFNRVTAQFNDFESLQAHNVPVVLYPKGYGSDYGYFYGGWPELPSVGIYEE